MLGAAGPVDAQVHDPLRGPLGRRRLPAAQPPRGRPHANRRHLRQVQAVRVRRAGERERLRESRVSRILGTTLSMYRARLKGGAPALVNIVTAVAHHFCPSLPAAFTQPADHPLAEPCMYGTGSYSAENSHFHFRFRASIYGMGMGGSSNIREILADIWQSRNGNGIGQPMKWRTMAFKWGISYE